MTIFEAVFLGIIQGLTEFLPVSSSGHLALFSKWLDVQQSSLLFEIVVHAGTLLAVLTVFYREVLLLITAFFKLVRQPGEARELLQADQGGRLLKAVVLATLPAVVLAFLFKSQIERSFTSSIFIGSMLILTGAILYLGERRERREKSLDGLSDGDALLIGLSQAAAMLPGLSRSGSTISVALVRGVDRESAARFSFILTIPVILGALLLSLGDLFGAGSTVGGGALAIGFVASAVTGYFTIRFFLNLVKKGRLIWFSYYTWFVGALVIVLQIL